MQHYTNSENLLGNLSLGLGFSSASGTRLPDVPYAYLKYVVYRADSSIATEGEQLVSGDAKDSWETLSLSTVIAEDGYIKIYVVNEDPVDVWFDDISIDHIQSPIAQQTDYYPFGLEITGTQYNREEWFENNYLANGGSEKFDDLGVYETLYRVMDPALGRWWQNDPLAEKFYPQNPYNVNFNNPILMADPMGDCPPPCPDVESEKVNEILGVESEIGQYLVEVGVGLLNHARKSNVMGMVVSLHESIKESAKAVLL